MGVGLLSALIDIGTIPRYGVLANYGLTLLCVHLSMTHSSVFTGKVVSLPLVAVNGSLWGWPGCSANPRKRPSRCMPGRLPQRTFKTG